MLRKLLAPVLRRGTSLCSSSSSRSGSSTRHFAAAAAAPQRPSDDDDSYELLPPGCSLKDPTYTSKHDRWVPSGGCGGRDGGVPARESRRKTPPPPLPQALAAATATEACCRPPHCPLACLPCPASFQPLRPGGAELGPQAGGGVCAAEEEAAPAGATLEQRGALPLLLLLRPARALVLAHWQPPLQLPPRGPPPPSCPLLPPWPCPQAAQAQLAEAKEAKQKAKAAAAAAEDDDDTYVYLPPGSSMRDPMPLPSSLSDPLDRKVGACRARCGAV